MKIKEQRRRYKREVGNKISIKGRENADDQRTS